MKRLRIGIVCPYSFDVPGGVQFHVRDLAEHFIAAGHGVNVLAPADDDDDALPPYFTSVGRAVPIRYNGSVARLTFGPVTANRVGKWIERGGFDVLHLHEPVTPSASVMALWAVTDQPVVATFHTATVRSRALHTFHPMLRPSLEKIRARIAVSEDARATVRRHLRADAYVIPNGVHVAKFADASRDERFTGTPATPTIAFLGRVDEPRKGLAVLLRALPLVLRRHPGARLLVAGPGDCSDLVDDLDPDVAAHVTVLGGVSESDKAALLHSVDLYIAPHLGGESFGIVLVEAMAAGAPVVAADLPAFLRVLGDPPTGVTFPVSDHEALAERIGHLLADPQQRRALAAAAQERALRFDWESVAERIMAVYELAMSGAELEPDRLPQAETLWGRLVRSGRSLEES
ncbi:MAG: glycosyltransferase family 4 protein [Tetrasphaera sp.]|nr:glycosyltransferase family 4 protein [Tetrasphaera sp.]